MCSVKQQRTLVIQNKNGQPLLEEPQIQERWTEYCSELYNYPLQGNPSVLDVNPVVEDQKEESSILKEEIIESKGFK